MTEVLSSIEISFRTYIAYTLAMNHGTIGYVDKRNFKNEWYHNIFISKLEMGKNNNSNKLFIKHHNRAHYGRIYNNLLPNVRIKNEDKNYEVDDKKIFAYILSMKHLIANRSVWDKFFINLQQLINQYNKYIELNKIGFSENWIEILSKKS